MSVERSAAGREDAAAEALGEAPALDRAEQPVIVVVEARPVVVVIRRRGAGLGLDNTLVYARAPRAQQGRLPADHSTRMLH